MLNKIKILVIDDSAFVRESLQQILNSDPELQVVGMACDPYDAARQLKELVPDVITLDIEMPKMDGLTFLKKLMNQHPIPVVVISTLTRNGGQAALNALRLGAIDVLGKPKLRTHLHMQDSVIKIITTVKAAAQAELSMLNIPTSLINVIKQRYPVCGIPARRIVVLGASTGGTEAIRRVLSAMPQDCPGIAIVQHMPEVFTRQFADRLNDECGIIVKEAEDGDILLNGQALIAPGDQHMLLKKRGAHFYVQLKSGQLVNGHRPSVDVLFKTAAKYAGSHAAGCLMTGMGRDGAAGLLEMRTTGAFTLAQNEESCVVFGMPREAIKIGAAEKVASLDILASLLLKWSTTTAMN